MWSSAPISNNILTITLNFDSNDYRIKKQKIKALGTKPCFL